MGHQGASWVELPIDSPNYAFWAHWLIWHILMSGCWWFLIVFSGNYQVLRSYQRLVVGVTMPRKAKLSYTGVLTHLWGGSYNYLPYRVSMTNDYELCTISRACEWLTFDLIRFHMHDTIMMHAHCIHTYDQISTTTVVMYNELTRVNRTRCNITWHPLPLRRTVLCRIGRIGFWYSVRRRHLESVKVQGPPLACCAHGFDRECRLHCNAR